MGYKLSCYTLFDITATGINSRDIKPIGVETSQWIYRRNTQCNFDTILQIISLRSQPENISNPHIKVGNSSCFGSEYPLNSTTECWQFTFNISHLSVFNNGIHEIGALFDDCNGVPMILVGTECPQLKGWLNTTRELKNIHFEILEVDNGS